MTALRLRSRSPNLGAVPQYESHAFGRYGKRVRVYRLKPGGHFYIEWDRGTQRKVIKPKTKDVDQALAHMGQFYRDRIKGIDALVAGRVTLGAVLDEYLEHRTPKKSKREQQADRRRAEMFRGLWGKQVPGLLTLRDWEAFTRDRQSGRIGAGRGRGVEGHAPATMRRGAMHCRPCKPEDAGVVPRTRRGAWLAAVAQMGKPVSSPAVRPRTVRADLLWLRGVLGWASRWRKEDGGYLLADNPVRGLPLPQDPNPRRPVASQDRYEALLATIEPLEGTRDECERLRRWPTELRLLLALANGTGRRLSAILSLRASDILRDEGPHGSIRWRAEYDKKGREWIVPMNERTRAEIKRYLRKNPVVGDAYLVKRRRGRKDMPLTRSGADHMLRRAERLAKLEPLSGSLWHAYRRGWATSRKHLPAADVAAAGGWKDTRTLQVCYQQSDRTTLLRVVTEAVELRESR